MEQLVEQILKLLVTVVLGGLVGYQREKSHKPAGLRTHMLVCMGSCLVSIISIEYFVTDTARIIAGLVTGIGFIGAGSIIAEGNRGAHGLTTAASLWVMSAIGIAVGIGWYAISVTATILITCILFLNRHERKELVK